MSDFAPDPCPENAESRVRNPDTNPVREPLSKPVKEEEGARAEISDDFFEELLKALGFERTALPGWWQGWPPREHVRRWRDDLGLDEAAIIEVAEESRRTHPAPPDGPKALDRAMQRAAQRLKQTGTTTAKATVGNGKATAQGKSTGEGKKRGDAPQPTFEDKAAFYADLVNSDRFLPANTISNAIRDAMLAQGLVTEARLRARGVR